MRDDQAEDSVGANAQTRSARQVDIEPLLCYLEHLGRGTWSTFADAVRSILPEVTTFEVADRLAAQAFIEFDWFEDRSWQFCRPALVEAKGPSTGFLGERDPLLSPEIEHSCWALFGISRSSAIALVTNYPENTWLIRNKSIAVGRVLLKFERVVIFDSQVKQDMLQKMSVSLLDALQLRQYLELLPDLRGAAHYWRGAGAPETAEIVRLEEALRTQFFRPETGQWEDRHFDRSPGMWRSEGTVPRYYLVSIGVPIASKMDNDVSRRVDILRVPPELGRWFEALKAKTTGKAIIKASSKILDIELGPAVVELPVLFERWLAMSGCRRFVLRQRPKVLRFTNISPADATILASRLHLLLEH